MEGRGREEWTNYITTRPIGKSWGSMMSAGAKADDIMGIINLK